MVFSIVDLLVVVFYEITVQLCFTMALLSCVLLGYCPVVFFYSVVQLCLTIGVSSCVLLYCCSVVFSRGVVH